MSITNIVIIISLLLVASVIGSIIFAKKEKAAQLRRQQVASYRFKADEAQDLYDGLSKAGLEKIAYQFLLERIVVNLKAAYDIDANAAGVKVRLNSAKSALESIDSTAFYIEIPSGMAELHGLVGRLNKLVKYLVVLFQKRLIQEHQYQQIMPAVQRTLLKFDAEGHIKLGHQAANEGQPGTAKQYYLHAKEKLLSFGIEDSYVTSQLEKVDELILSLEGETGDANLEQSARSSGQTDSPTPISGNQNKDEVDVKISQEEINRKNDESTDFAPKKKW